MAIDTPGGFAPVASGSVRIGPLGTVDLRQTRLTPSLALASAVLQDHRLLVFFAAKGVNGESPFDPSLPKREGNLVQYIKDRLLSYHTWYDSAGRGITNLRKNNKFDLMATGTAGRRDGRARASSLVRAMVRALCNTAQHERRNAAMAVAFLLLLWL